MKLIEFSENTVYKSVYPLKELYKFYSCQGYRLYLLLGEDLVLPVVRVGKRNYYSLPFFSFGGPRLLFNGSAEGFQEYFGESRLNLYYRMHVKSPVQGEKSYAIMDIEQFDSIDGYLNSVSKSARSKMRRSHKNGFRFVNVDGFSYSSEQLRDFYNVYVKNIHLLRSLPYSFSFFENLLNSFGKKSVLCLVYLENEVVAGGINICFDGIYENQYFATDIAARKSYVAYYLYFNMIEQAIIRGFNYFSFGRSTAESSLESFKIHLGAVIYPMESNIISYASSWKSKFVSLWPVALRKMAGPYIAERLF